MQAQFRSDGAELKKLLAQVSSQKEKTAFLRMPKASISDHVEFAGFLRNHEIWMEKERRDQNIELARLMAAVELQRQKTKKSFGKCRALSRLIAAREK